MSNIVTETACVQFIEINVLSQLELMIYYVDVYYFCVNKYGAMCGEKVRHRVRWKKIAFLRSLKSCNQ